MINAESLASLRLLRIYKIQFYGRQSNAKQVLAMRPVLFAANQVNLDSYFLSCFFLSLYSRLESRFGIPIGWNFGTARATRKKNETKWAKTINWIMARNWCLQSTQNRLNRTMFFWVVRTETDANEDDIDKFRIEMWNFVDYERMENESKKTWAVDWLRLIIIKRFECHRQTDKHNNKLHDKRRRTTKNCRK